MLAAGGDYRFVRPALSLWSTFPLPARLLGAVEAAGGSAWGDAPPQSLWYLGGGATVRGYGIDTGVSGDSYWRARAELGTQFPAARVVLFSDAGWAGARRDLGAEPQLLSAGIGAGFLDGLLRLDLSRALRAPTGWRLDLRVNGVM